MAKKEIAVKKCVVRLSKDERDRLKELIRKGKSPAKQQLKARILLKADVSKEGESWSDSQIIRALNTSVSMVYRVRQQLVEEGFEAVLSRKQRAAPPVPRIFDGEKEARLITVACSQAPPGQARWTLNLLANKVVELKIVMRPAAAPWGAFQKKRAETPSQTAMGYSTGREQFFCGIDGRNIGRLHTATRFKATFGVSG